MDIKSYKKVLWGMLVAGELFAFGERLLFYKHLQPALSPDSDSIAIPLFTEGVLFACILSAFSWAQCLLGAKLDRSNVSHIANLYFPGQDVSFGVRLRIYLLPILMICLAGALLFSESMLLRGDLFRACLMLPAILYAILLANYWGNAVFV